MLRPFVVLGLILCFFAQVSAEKLTRQDSIRNLSTDTFLVHEVSVVSSVSGKFQAGQRIEEFSAQKMGTIGGGNLTDLISRYAPIYIKSDAGGLSTIRIRGTSPSHTAIYFGGLNINSLTLGQSNLANISTYLFDEIALQYGSSSAENGSGSIGGSIRLGFKKQWTNGYDVEASGNVGSFGRNMVGAKVFVGNGKWESVTRVQKFYLQNNFPFWNTEYIDFESDKGYERDEQRFSVVDNRSLIQELNYRFNRKESIVTSIWLTDNQHQAQPNMTDNKSESLTEQAYRDKNLRIWTAYKNSNGKINYHVAAGGVMDNAVNVQVDSQSIKTKRFVAEAEMAQKLRDHFEYKAGVKYKRIKPEVYAYQGGYIEEHLDVFASLYKQFFHKLKLSLNLRQQFVTGFNTPFTPSLGADYLLLNASHSYLKLLGSISKSYRIPTFNDRFWTPGGNSNLKPENGKNYELGAKYTYCSSQFTLNAATQFFYHDVDNWLQWKQGNNGWEASNELRVISKGVELHADFTVTTGKVFTSGGMNYTYNEALRMESESSTDALNSQLEYVPVHIGNVWAGMHYRQWALSLDASYTGERSYNQIGGILDAYTLLNATGFHTINLKKQSFKLMASVKNIFNVSYQNQYSYAMPEVSYVIGLTYNLDGKQ